LDSERVSKTVCLASSDASEGEKGLQALLLYAYRGVKLVIHRSKRNTFARLRRVLYFTNYEIRQHALHWHIGFLGVQKELITLEALWAALDCILDSHAGVTKKEHERVGRMIDDTQCPINAE
jgi:hypothetical protein